MSRSGMTRSSKGSRQSKGPLELGIEPATRRFWERAVADVMIDARPFGHDRRRRRLRRHRQVSRPRYASAARYLALLAGAGGGEGAAGGASIAVERLSTQPPV